MTCRIKKMNADLVSDFYRVHSGECGWCYCVAWDVPTWNGWDKRTDEQNRAHREAMFKAGRYDGYLLYVDDQPVGWTQCGPLKDLLKLVKQYGLDPDPEAYAISCMTIIPAHRGKGLSPRFISAMMEDLRSKGVKHVYAFPRREDHSWTGPESTFTTNKFRAFQEDPKRPVLLKEL